MKIRNFSSLPQFHTQQEFATVYAEYLHKFEITGDK